MAEQTEKINVTIDGKTIAVDPGTTILNAARAIGGEVVPPAMCYYSRGKAVAVSAAHVLLK